MSVNVATPWHKRSYDRTLQERLPKLLSGRVPLVSYAALSSGPHTCEIHLALASGHNGELELTYSGIPQPDEEGLFEIEGDPYIVVPTASHEALGEAEIRCVGEQLYAYVEARLGQAPADLTWDAALARAWLPLDTWVDAFLAETARPLEATNWVSYHTHLRRLIVLQNEHVIAPGQIGLVCPFESPEGPGMGRVLTVAVGAEIRDGRLVAVDERPVVRDRPGARLGISASLIPLLEHDDPNRILMGANMLRQALVPPDPEPALVQTGNEPDVPGFWTGRNLLTALISWGVDTTADGIVISQSCARRLDYPYPAEPGDKLANRHGAKGVVSRVLPDDEMPHLPDGTPVELVYGFSGLHVRMNYGQVREALLGRIARAEGEPTIAPAFGAPGKDELHARLAAAGLPTLGMETLTMGAGGPPLARPSLVGWVYWNRLTHLAKPKLQASAAERGRQLQGVLECQALLDVGAHENLRETLNTRAARRSDAGTLVARLEAGPVEQAGPPTPVFAELVQRLRVAGIEAALEGNKVAFRLVPPGEGALRLARPVRHPWLRERELEAIGPSEEIEADERYIAGIIYSQESSGTLGGLRAARAHVVEANERLARMLAGGAPERLVEGAVAGLEARVRAFFDLLLTRQQLRFFEPQLFSGRAVLVPGSGLQLDQVGLPEEMAWTLFGPLVTRELGSEGAVEARQEDAAQTLDAVMARSWAIVHRAPVLSPTALLAFHPLRDPGPAIRLHPLACKLLDADFDGDQAAIYLPLTEAAQAEAGEKLSVAGHLARDPSLVEALLPPAEALWGLASLGLEGGLDEIAALAGGQVGAPNGVINERTLGEAMRALLQREGVGACLAAAQRLMARGFEVVRASGASMSPFLGEGLALPPQPEAEDVDAWRVYIEELTAMLLSRTDYQDPDLGPQLLAVQTRERGRSQLVALLGPKILTDIEARPVIARHSCVEGVTPEELYTWIIGARRGLTQYWQRWETLSAEIAARASPAFTVLARARRAEHPGIVFARAAAAGEVDPLTDVESRMLVGLPA